MQALLGSGNGAGRVTARDSIAKPCYETVSEVADRTGNQFQGNRDIEPWTGQLGEHGEDAVCPRQQTLPRASGVLDDNHGVGNEGADVSAGEEIGDNRRVGRGESEAVVAVAAEKPADGAIAEAALAVIDDEQAALQLRERGDLCACHVYTDGTGGVGDSDLRGGSYT